MTAKHHIGSDGQKRCRWAGGAPEFEAYHDAEWGYPVDDDVRLFEKLSLESFQSGLSWRTILSKRPAFRKAFKGFDPRKVARFNARDRARLLADAGIVRHAGKIDATIHNAARCLELQDEFGSLAAYVWRFEPAKGDRPRRITHDWLREQATSPASVALSKDLKKRGWKFFGPTTAYAFMQAMGLVNDHVETCCMRKAALEARKRFQIP